VLITKLVSVAPGPVIALREHERAREDDAARRDREHPIEHDHPGTLVEEADDLARVD
jgi:hypothetical protein